MDITLKNRHIYVGMQLISGFAERELPWKISYAVGKSLVALEVQAQFIEAQRKKIIRKHQKKDDDGVGLMKKGPVDVPLLDDDDATAQELDALLDEDTEISIYCIKLDAWSKYMDKDKCKECKRETIDVSSNEMAALIRLGILVDDDDD